MFFTHSSFWPNLAVCCCLPVALAACEPAQDPDAISPSTAVYFEALMRGQSAAFADTVEMVVRDAESWDALLGRLETLLPSGAITLEELESARKTYLVDSSQVVEKEASLALAGVRGAGGVPENAVLTGVTTAPVVVPAPPFET